MGRPKVKGAILGWSELIKKTISYIDSLPEGDSRAARMLKGSLRDLWFRFWHECNLPEDSNFSTTDIDYVESKDGDIIALIEAKPLGMYPSEYQMDTYTKISNALGIPFFVILFDSDGKEPFKVDCYVNRILQKPDKSPYLSEEGLIDFYFKLRNMKRKKLSEFHLADFLPR